MDFRITDTADGGETDDFTESYVRAEPGDPRHAQPLTAKRMLDVGLAIAALVFLAPLLLTACLLIRLQDGGQAIFPHTRYGLGGRTFKCLKLRSMVPDAAERLQTLIDSDPVARREWEETQKLTNDPRVTALGKFIRASSIDELPQLLNVIRGDMSLVGPRPISMSERSRYGDGFADYCSVRPGITGKWQISGRSNISYTERVAMDVAYARTRTFWGDVLIMVKTIPAVLFSIGAR
jgi:exopolysaccharide production protein ExoY